jgi:hypothetical protein
MASKAVTASASRILKSKLIQKHFQGVLRSGGSVFLTYETIRCWQQKFRQTFANDFRRRHSHSGDKEFCSVWDSSCFFAEIR